MILYIEITFLLKLTKLLQKEKESEYRGSYKNTKEYQRL